MGKSWLDPKEQAYQNNRFFTFETEVESSLCCWEIHFDQNTNEVFQLLEARSLQGLLTLLFSEDASKPAKSTERRLPKTERDQ